VTINTHFSNFH